MKRIQFHMNIPMLNRTNQLLYSQSFLMMLIGHPIYGALIGIFTIYTSNSWCFNWNFHDLQHETLNSSVNRTTISVTHKLLTEFWTMGEVYFQP